MHNCIYQLKCNISILYAEEKSLQVSLALASSGRGNTGGASQSHLSGDFRVRYSLEITL